jgi:alpha-glucosidase
MLQLYRQALRLRRDHRGFATGEMRWLPSPEGTLVFERGHGLRCAVNLAEKPLALPAGRSTLLASAPLVDDHLPVDAAAWFVATSGASAGSFS